MDISPTGIYLYWIPLGAGHWFVRLNGKVFEALSGFVGRRPRCDLYHSALEVTVPGCRFVIEMTPIPDPLGSGRGVVSEDPVGARWAGRFRLFRYEIRRWPHGVIPDGKYAIASPMQVTDDEKGARRLLDLVPHIPTLIWGRDELRTGDMWNSNSVVAWLLARSGIDAALIQPPQGGRAPGWREGLVVARQASPQSGPHRSSEATFRRSA